MKPSNTPEDLTLCSVYQATKARFEKMSANELYEENLSNYRIIRNQKLEQTDIYINQIDRFTAEQINELKTYRQALRDYMNIHFNTDNVDIPPPFPEVPLFLVPIINKFNNANISKI